MGTEFLNIIGINNISNTNKTNDIISLSHFFNQILDQTNEAILISEYFSENNLSQFILVNNEACLLLNYSKNECYHKNLFELIPDKFHKKIIDAIQQSNKNEKCILKTELTKKNGSKINVEILTGTIKQEDRTFIIHTIKNISTSKDSIKVETSIGYYQRLFDEMLDGFYKSTPDGKLIEANEALAKMLGYASKEELMSFNIITTFYFSKSERNPKDHREINGVDVYRLKKKDGSEIWVEDSCTFIYDNNGKVQFYEGVLRDITERKLTEEKIHESSQLIDRIINSINVRVFWKDKDSKYLGCNQFFAEDAGFKNPDELIGKDDYQMAWKEMAHLYRIDDKQVIESGIPKLNIEEPLKNSEGKLITLITNKIPLKNANGEIYGVLGTYIDISDRKDVESTLETSKMHLSAILQSTADGLLAIGKENEVLFYNERFNQLWNIPIEKTESRNDKILLEYILDQLINPNEFLEKVKELYVSDKESYDLLLFKDGRQFERYSCSLKDGKEILGRVWSFRDITEKKKNERELIDSKEKIEESELRFRAIFENANVGIAIGKNNLVISLNKVIEEITGYSSNELINKPILDYFHPEDKPILIERAIKRENGEFVETSIIVRLIHKNGSIKYVNLSTSQFVLNNEKYIQTIFVDITEKYYAERELIKAKEKAEENEKQYRILFDMSPSGVMLISLEGTIIDANKAVCESLGYKPEELIGKNIKMIVPPLHKPSVDENISFLSTGIKNEHVVENIRKDGSSCLLELHETLISLPNGQQGILAVSNDITERKRIEAQNKANEARFRALIEQSPLAKQIINRKGETLAVNPAWEKMWGVPLSALSHYHMFEDQQLIDSGIVDQLKQVLNGLTITFEDKLYDRSATKEVNSQSGKIWVRTKAFPLKDEIGNINEIVLVQEDVTLKKEAEVIERQNEARFRAVIDSSPVPYAINDNKGNIIYLNSTFTKTFGYDLTDIPTLEDWWPAAYPNSEYRSWVTKTWNERISIARSNSSAFEPMEINIQCKNGSVKTALVSAASIGEFNKDMHLVILYDITDRKKVEAELKRAKEEVEKSEKNLIQAQKIASIGSWVYYFNEDKLTWTDEIANIFNLGNDTYPNSIETIISFIHPDDKDIFQHAFNKTIEEKTNLFLEYRVILKNGQLKWIVARAKVYEDENKQIHIAGTLQDITERVLASIEREKIMADIVTRNQELEQFSYIVSHNLRAPVANIIGLNDLLKLNLTNGEEITEVAEGINTSVIKLDSVITDLNHILNIRNIMNQPKEQVQISVLINDIKTSIQSIILECNVTFKQNFKEIDSIHTIKSYLTSIFYNLISNSIKYRNKEIKTDIKISSHKIGDSIEIIYSDNGIGFDMNKRKNEVFGLYKRFHTHVEGKGMGLYMVKAQIEALGGKIQVESEVNKGTTFKLSIPIL